MESARLDDVAVRARRGDRAALGELYEATRPVWGRVLRLCRKTDGEGPLQTADLEQQTYLILADLARSWRGLGPFSAWLRRLFPLALKRYRRSVLHWDGPPVKSLPHDELALLLDTGPCSAEPDPVDTVLCRQLLAELPLAYRRLLCWRFVDGLTYREIERLHHVPATTAQAQCERALAHLRAKAEGLPAPPLAPIALPARREQTSLVAALEELCRLAGLNDGLLPAAATGAAAVGLGRRAYDNLIARLTEAGCLGSSEGVSFTSRQGRRRRLLVGPAEARRRLALDTKGRASRDRPPVL